MLGIFAGAIILAIGMLLPQTLTSISVPGGHVSDRQVRRFLDAEGEQ